MKAPVTPQHPLVKIAALVSFALLMTTFVAFRAGVFETSTEVSVSESETFDPEASISFLNHSADSTPPIISSSKSMQVFVPLTKKELRQAEKKRKQQARKKKQQEKKAARNKKTLPKKIKPSMSSSKSAAVFNPEDYKNRPVSESPSE